MSSDKYDSVIFRDIVQDAVNRFEFPIVNINIDDSLRSITTQFTGEITASDEKTRLQTALCDAVIKVFDSVNRCMQDTVREFKNNVQTVSDELQNGLLHDIQAEFETLLTQYADKEREIASYRAYIALLGNELAKG